VPCPGLLTSPPWARSSVGGLALSDEHRLRLGVRCTPQGPNTGQDPAVRYLAEGLDAVRPWLAAMFSSWLVLALHSVRTCGSLLWLDVRPPSFVCRLTNEDSTPTRCLPTDKSSQPGRNARFSIPDAPDNVPLPLAVLSVRLTVQSHPPCVPWRSRPEMVHLPAKKGKLVKPSRIQERIGIRTGMPTPEEASCG
jgi:hypothetical protein